MTMPEGFKSSTTLRGEDVTFSSHLDVVYSCAGAFPWNQGWCAGTDDGRVLIAHRHGGMKAPPLITLPSGDAINGIAFSRNAAAASSCSEVRLYIDNNLDGNLVPFCELAIGAHDIVETSGGGFIAPLGIDGMLVVELEPNGQPLIRFMRPKHQDIDVYRIADLAMTPGGNVFACAARREGFLIATIPRGGTGGTIRPYRTKGIDLIDVCSLGDPSYPLAAAALGRDRAIYLSRNVLTDIRPVTLNHAGPKGDAFSMACCGPHIFLLTSEGIYAFPYLARDFLSGRDLSGDTMMHHLPHKAVDIYSAYGEFFIILMPRRFIALPVNQLAQLSKGVSKTERSSERPQKTSNGFSSYVAHGKVSHNRSSWGLAQAELFVEA